jgi:lipopolysaccharide transport system ATP-binding protein
MSQVSKGEGRTVLFVSHNMGAIRNLCTHALLMHHGTLKADGNTVDIIDTYLSQGSDIDRLIEWSPDERPKADELVVRSIKVLDSKGRIDNVLTTSDDLFVEIDYQLRDEIKDLRVVVNLITPDGIEVFSSSDFGFQNDARLRKAGEYKSVCHIPGKLLNAGNYIARIDFDVPRKRALVMGLPVTFTISELMYNQLGITNASKPAGIIHPYLTWNVNRYAD